jgi:hypothetical protein
MAASNPKRTFAVESPKQKAPDDAGALNFIRSRSDQYFATTSDDPRPTFGSARALNYCDLKFLTKTILGTDVTAVIVYQRLDGLVPLTQLNGLCYGHAHGCGFGLIGAEARVFLLDDPAVFGWKN